MRPGSESFKNYMIHRKNIFATISILFALTNGIPPYIWLIFLFLFWKCFFFYLSYDKINDTFHNYNNFSLTFLTTLTNFFICSIVYSQKKRNTDSIMANWNRYTQIIMPSRSVLPYTPFGRRSSIHKVTWVGNHVVND